MTNTIANPGQHHVLPSVATHYVPGLFLGRPRTGRLQHLLSRLPGVSGRIGAGQPLAPHLGVGIHRRRLRPGATLGARDPR